MVLLAAGKCRAVPQRLADPATARQPESERRAVERWPMVGRAREAERAKTPVNPVTVLVAAATLAVAATSGVVVAAG